MGSFIEQAPVEIKYMDLYSKLFIYIHTFPTSIYALWNTFISKQTGDKTCYSKSYHSWYFSGTDLLLCGIFGFKQGSEVAHVGKAYRHV